MMVEKPDWTKQLGAAFTSDEQAVYQSIQRLRAAAMALGNLKTTPQQEVVTEASSTGQTIILVQPANPQVVYVPVYNTQVVYVQQAPPPSTVHRRTSPPPRWSASRWASSSGPRRITTTTVRMRGTAAARRTTTRTSGGRTTWITARTSTRTARTTARTCMRTARTPARTRMRTRRSGSRQQNQSQRQTAGSQSDRARQPGRTAVHGADEPGSAADNSQHRERWKRADGASQSSEPAVHGAVEPVEPSVGSQHLRLPEWRKRKGPECEGKLQPRHAAASGSGSHRTESMRRSDHRILTAVLGLMLFLLPACAPAPAPDRTTLRHPGRGREGPDERAQDQQRRRAEGDLRSRRREGPVVGRPGVGSTRPRDDGPRHWAVLALGPGGIRPAGTGDRR